MQQERQTENDNTKRESQFQLMMGVACSGTPLPFGSKRTKSCQARLEFIRPPNADRRAVRKKLHDEGWHNLRTLEERTWLCPRCSAKVKDKRAANKARWG